MISWIIALLAGLSGVCLIRVLRGPTLLDRIAAADGIGIMMIAILVLLGILFKRTIFLDIAIVYALLLFVDLLVIAKYLEPESPE